jgi:hypothetical protein
MAGSTSRTAKNGPLTFTDGTRPQKSGVADENVDAAEREDRFAHHRSDALGLRGVGHDSEDSIAVLACGAHARCRFGERFGGHIREHEVRALRGESLGDRAADAAAGARDEHHFVLKSHGS